MFEKLKNLKNDKTAMIIVKFVPVSIVGLLVVLSIWIYFGRSFGWFSSSLNSSTEGMQVVVHTIDYDILIERRSEYDNSSVYENVVNSGGLKERLSGEGYDLSASGTNASSKIAFEMVNDVQDYDKHYNLRPGSYGTVTFYIKPSAGVENLSLNLSLEIGAFYIKNDSSGVLLDRVDNQKKVLDLLKGHILLFGGESDDVYSDFISDGVYKFTTEGKSKIDSSGSVFNGCYKVTLYWHWPQTYKNISDMTIGSSGVIDSSSNMRSYPSDLRGYVNTHPNYFFANISYNDGDTLDDIDLSNEQLNDAYNDADQLIGMNAQFLVLYISVN